MVIRDDRVAANPELAADVFDAFARSKALYMERLKAGRIEMPTEIDKLHARGFTGRFISVAGAGHGVNKGIQGAVRELITLNR